MRRRMILPEVFTDEELCEHLDTAGRHCYIGMMCMAEDSGVLLLSAHAIKMRVFPGDDEVSRGKIEDYLKTLMRLHKVIPFESDGKTYGYIKNFHVHQRLDKPSPPTLPLPEWICWIGGEKRHQSLYMIRLIKDSPEWLKQVFERVPTRLRLVHDMSKTSAGHAHDESALIEEKRREENKRYPPSDDEGVALKGLPHDLKTQKDDYTEEFELFWSVYPRKIEKRAAFAKWGARIKERVLPDDLITAAINYAADCKTQERPTDKIKHGATFLGPNKAYEDYVKGSPEPPMMSGKSQESIRRPEPYQHEAPTTAEEDMARQRALDEALGYTQRGG